MRDFNRAAQVGFDQESRERREKNRVSSAEILKLNKVEFESKDGGRHLVIRLKDRVIDFWPGTGTWIDRKHNRNERGVFNLLKKIQRLKARHDAASKLL